LEEESGGWRARRKAWMEEEKERGMREEEEEDKMKRTQATGKLENVKSGWDDNNKNRKIERKTNERETKKESLLTSKSSARSSFFLSSIIHSYIWYAAKLNFSSSLLQTNGEFMIPVSIYTNKLHRLRSLYFPLSSSISPS